MTLGTKVLFVHPCFCMGPCVSAITIGIDPVPSWNALPVHGAAEVCKGHDLGLMMSTGISGAPIQLSLVVIL